MAEQQSALTYEGVFEMIRESGHEFDRRMEESSREFDRRMEESRRKFDRRMEESGRKFDRRMEESRREFDRMSKKTDKKISKLGSRIGEIIECMVEGNIVKKFQSLGYDVEECSRNKSFDNRKLGISGEIDLLVGDGDISILIEVKTTLEEADVLDHIERLEKYRRHADANGGKNKCRFLGAVAGAVVRKKAVETAFINGLYVIVQSGEAVKIVKPPDGFKAKEW